MNKFVDEFDIDELDQKQEEVNSKQNELDTIVNEARLLQKDYNTKSTKLKLLDEVPCGSEYSHCKFIHDAYKAKEAVPHLKDKIFESLTTWIISTPAVS